MKVWHDRELEQVQKKQNTTPFRTSADPSRYGRYVDAVLEDWDVPWGFAAQRKARKLRFRASVDAQRALDQEITKHCSCTAMLRRPISLVEQRATSKVQPRRSLMQRCAARRLCACGWTSSARPSSTCTGHSVHHPRETRAEHTRPPACRAKRHAMDVPGCRCFCVHRSGYAAKRTVSRWCAEHAKPQFQYDVCYHNHGQKHGHRTWYRDVVGALNIGCLFLAQSLGLDPGL